MSGSRLGPPPASEKLVSDYKPLGATFFARPAEEVARELLGTWLVSTVGGIRVAGRVVETEAYLGPDDPASHAAARIGRTRRNRSMFGPAGTAYVYRIYGLHWCLNAVTDEPEFPAAVLMRAIQPVEGEAIMRRRRSEAGGRIKSAGDIAGGPARLAQALAIDSALDGHPLDRPPLAFVHPHGEPFCRVGDEDVERGPRIGVTRARDWPLRFWIRGNPHVSR